MSRIIALDYGTKRVGIAVTDAMQMIASPLDTVHAKDIIPFLETYIQQEDVEAIVLGFPKRMDNTDTHATQHVVGFNRKLSKLFPQLSIFLVDERFTSKIAFDSMIAGGLNKKARQEKGTIDKVSATIILQSFLESRDLKG